MEDTRRTWTTESRRYGLPETESVTTNHGTHMDLYQVLCVYGRADILVFHCGAPTVGAGEPLTLWPALETLCSCWVAWSSFHMRPFAFSYCALFSPLWLLVGGGIISEEKTEWGRIWAREEGGELGTVEGGETVLGRHCMWKQSVFNKKRKERNQSRHTKSKIIRYT